MKIHRASRRISLIFANCIIALSCIVTQEVSAGLFQKKKKSSDPLIIPITHSTNLEHFSLKSTNTWQEFEQHNKELSFNDEKSVLTNMLTFRSKNAVRLTKLILHWKGQPIKNLEASLYKKHKNFAALPIEKHVVSDGCWDRHAQQLKFSLDEKLIAKDMFYIVLSFPLTEEAKLKEGDFAFLGQEQLAVAQHR